MKRARFFTARCLNQSTITSYSASALANTVFELEHYQGLSLLQVLPTQYLNQNTTTSYYAPGLANAVFKSEHNHNSSCCEVAGFMRYGVAKSMEWRGSWIDEWRWVRTLAGTSTIGDYRGEMRMPGGTSMIYDVRKIPHGILETVWKIKTSRLEKNCFCAKLVIPCRRVMY